VKIRRYHSADYESVISFLKEVFDEMGFEFLPDGKDVVSHPGYFNFASLRPCVNFQVQ
jgi:hypothetical protein